MIFIIWVRSTGQDRQRKTRVEIGLVVMEMGKEGSREKKGAIISAKIKDPAFSLLRNRANAWH